MTKKTDAAKPNMMEAFCLRYENAREDFSQTLQQFGGITPEQAEHAMDVMLQLKVAKVDYQLGRISVKHGAFLDRQAILNAVNLQLKPKKTSKKR